MKGFIHTIEAVLASFLLLSALMIIGQHIRLSWDRAGSTVLAYSMLNSLSGSGALRQNIYENTHSSYVNLTSYMRRIMPFDGGFMLVVHRVPKPVYYVFAQHEALLPDFGRGEIVKFSGINHTVSNRTGSLSGIINDRSIYGYDAVFAEDADVSGLSGSQMSVLMDYVSSGGIFVFFGPSSSSNAKNLVGSYASGNFQASFLNSFEGVSLSEIFKRAPAVSYLKWNQATFSVEGNITLRGTPHLYSVGYSGNTYCINYSGNCYFEGQTFKVGADHVKVQKINPPDDVFFNVVQPHYKFLFYGSGNAGQCLAGSGSRCGVSVRREGNGEIYWVAGMPHGVDRSGLFRALLIHGTRSWYISPSYLESSNDVRKRFDMPHSEFVRRATVIDYFDGYPAVVDLYVWPLY